MKYFTFSKNPSCKQDWLFAKITGVRTEIFQGKGGFLELGHFDKHFVKNTRKKRAHREKFAWEPIKVQIFRLSTAHEKFHQICTLIGSFCWNYIKVQLEKYRGVMSHDPEEWCKIWRKTDFLFQKWHEFGKFWREHSKVSRICTLIGSYCVKYLMFDLKKYRWVIFHDTEECCKIWRKTELWFEKWHKKFGNFSPEHSKVTALKSVKIGTLMGSFFPK